MQTITCEVLTEIDGEEIHIGHIHIYSPPRKGEYIWFSEKRNGHSSWVVEDVAHHVGNGKLGSYPMGYQSIFVYVKPTNAL